MTDKENIPAQALIRALNAKLREEIAREIADLPQADLRGVLRMIAVWKGAEMTDAELAQHDSKTLLQLLLSADARCDDLTAQLESTLKDRALILAERDRLREALTELLEVSRRAVRLSVECDNFKLYAMEPMERAILLSRYALKGESHD